MKIAKQSQFTSRNFPLMRYLNYRRGMISNSGIIQFNAQYGKEEHQYIRMIREFENHANDKDIKTQFREPMVGGFNKSKGHE